MSEAAKMRAWMKRCVKDGLHFYVFYPQDGTWWSIGKYHAKRI